MATTKNRNRRTSVSVDTDTVVLKGIVRVVGRRLSWLGSMTDLNAALRKVVTRQSDWPRNPRQLRSTVDRVVNQLRRLGVKTHFGRHSDHNRRRFVEFFR